MRIDQTVYRQLRRTKKPASLPKPVGESRYWFSCNDVHRVSCNGNNLCDAHIASGSARNVDVGMDVRRASEVAN